MPAPVTTESIWKQMAKRLFAVLSYTNAEGAPRSAGVVYVVEGRKLYVATETDSWKARHIRQRPQVAVNVVIARRIPFLPFIEIPSATIAFHGDCRVLDAQALSHDLLRRLLSDKADDPEVLAGLCFLEITPAGHFATYGVGVSTMAMRDRAKARGRAPV